jgi:hypothetical protein
MINTLTHKSTYQTNTNFPKHAAMVVLMGLTGFTQTACGSEFPDSAKIYQKNIEEYAKRSRSDVIYEPFGQLMYIRKVDAKTARDFKEKDSRGRARSYYGGDYGMLQNGDVYQVTTKWPIEAAIKVTKQMKQQDCSKDVTQYGIKYKCLVTVDNLSKVMPDLKDFYTNTGFRGGFKNNNTLKGQITVKNENDIFEFLSFRSN